MKTLKRKQKFGNEQIIASTSATWRPKYKTKTDDPSKYSGAESLGISRDRICQTLMGNDYISWPRIANLENWPANLKIMIDREVITKHTGTNSQGISGGRICQTLEKHDYISWPLI